MLHPAPAGRWQTSAMSVEKWLLRANRWVLVALMATMAMLVFANVVSRYVLNYSLIWVEELTRYLMVWVGFLGAGLLRLGAHIAVDAFQDLLRARGARASRVHRGCARGHVRRHDLARSALRGVRLGPGDAGHELEHGSDLPRNPDRLRASPGSSCFHRPRLRAQSRIRQGRDFHSVVNTALIVVFLAALVLGVPIAFAMVIAAIAAIPCRAPSTRWSRCRTCSPASTASAARHSVLHPRGGADVGRCAHRGAAALRQPARRPCARRARARERAHAHVLPASAARRSPTPPARARC